MTAVLLALVAVPALVVAVPLLMLEALDVAEGTTVAVPILLLLLGSLLPTIPWVAGRREPQRQQPAPTPRRGDAMGGVGRATEGRGNAPEVRAAGRAASGQQVEWLGNLKVVLIAMIIAVHGVLSYAGLVEVWNYSESREVTLHPVTEAIVFVFVAPFGLFLITLLFLVAGLLTPGSVRRKGVRRFVRDRLLRLGVPFLVFVFVLEPTLTYALEHPLGDAPGSFVDEYLGAEKVLDTGPLWFVGVLLVFSLGYAAWVSVSGREGSIRAAPVTLGRVIGLMAVVAVASFLVRLVYPYGSEAGVTDGQYWEWPACLAAFGLGIRASQEGWVNAVPERLWRSCRRLALSTQVRSPGR